MAKALSFNSVVVRNIGFIDAAIDDEIVALSIANGTCYGMNWTASRVWALIAAPTRVADICTELMTSHKVEPDVCERQVLDLLEEFRAEGLVIISEEK